MYFLIIFLCRLYSAASNLQDPCLHYQELDEWQRSVANTELSSICDTFLSGWYRIVSGAGEEMPASCIEGGFRCGTVNPIWMNGTYPSAGETKNVTACASSYDGDCCRHAYTMGVKNCSGYYVYNLIPPKACPEAYCFGFELPCPSGEISVTGFTPGCKYEPCLPVNYKVINDWQRSANNKNNDTTLCDSGLQPGWYRATSLAGELMPTSCVEKGFACGTEHPIWMDGILPPAGMTSNVTGCSSTKNGNCCANRYDIQVRNCSDFFIYYLKNTNFCPEAYCFGTEIPCLVGETSMNGFSPGCELDPCHETNYNVIRGQERRSSNYTLMTNEAPIDDSQLTQMFYRFDSPTGNDIVNTEQHMYQCGTKFPLYMIGTLPDVSQKTVFRRFCMSGDSGTCQNETEINIRNCGNFRVYELKPTPQRFSGYCVGTGPVTVPEKTSPKPSSKATDDKDVPWIATVAVLGFVCIGLTCVLIYKKVLTKTKVHEDTLPPPYEHLEISKVPVVSYTPASKFTK